MFSQPVRVTTPFHSWQIALVNDSQTNLLPVGNSNFGSAEKVWIQPASGNVGHVYLGDSDVDNSQGFVLRDGSGGISDALTLQGNPGIDLSQIFAIADNDDDAIIVAIQPLAG